MDHGTFDNFTPHLSWSIIKSDNFNTIRTENTSEQIVMHSLWLQLFANGVCWSLLMELTKLNFIHVKQWLREKTLAIVFSSNNSIFLHNTMIK